MKRSFICLVLVIAALALGTCTALGEVETIHISSVEGLLRMAENPHASYVLDCDIDLAGVQWDPFHFYGTLDGNGHRISHLSVNAFAPEAAQTVDGNNLKYDTQVAGFFSVVENATVRNISFTDASIVGESEGNAYIAIVAGVSTHSTFDEVRVTGSAYLRCGGKMGGVGGIVGFGTGLMTDSEADVTLVYVDTNRKTKCEQFLGGALANGYMDCINVTVHVDGYASVYGYVHCGGVIGMHRQFEKRTAENGTSYIFDCTGTGMITFFECNTDRRAYCAAIIGERLNKYTKLSNNDDSGFTRNEIKQYDQILLPEGWE